MTKDDFDAIDPMAGRNTPKTVAVSGTSQLGAGRLSRPLVVGINTWAGHAPGIVANGGLEPNPNGHYARVHGIELKFILIEDPSAKLAASPTCCCRRACRPSSTASAPSTRSPGPTSSSPKS